jgi:hypothetical protein
MVPYIRPLIKGVVDGGDEQEHGVIPCILIYSMLLDKDAHALRDGVTTRRHRVLIILSVMPPFPPLMWYITPLIYTI